MNARPIPSSQALPPVEALIPHRAPFLFIDGIADLVPGIHATAWRAVPADDPQLIHMGDGRTLLPAVIVLEAMAQTALLVAASAEPGGAASVLLRGIERARFRTPVPAGTMLHLSCRRQGRRGAVWTAHATAAIAGRVVATARISALVGMAKDRGYSSHAALRPSAHPLNEARCS